MRTRPIHWLAWSASISLVLMAVTSSAAAQDAGRKDVQPKADELMRAMSDYLGALRAFKFTADHTTEVVTKQGQKLQFVATSDVIVKRPDRLRSDRRGEIADAAFFYDGKTFTIHGKRAGLYAVTKAPPTLDEAIDVAREKLELEAPAADLLYSDVYAALMEDVVFGVYAGQAEIDGRSCHHLAFRGSETDWQIWIEAGARPVPCKYVIVSKKLRAAPTFSVQLREWNTAPEIAPNTFKFEPPSGSEQIDFLPRAESRPREKIQKMRRK